MVSYSDTSYTNDFFDLSGVYFNSTSQSSSSAVDLDELDKSYLLKSGGDISNNLIINGSLDVKANITLPDIGDVEDTIQGKQDTTNDGDLTISKTSGLQDALNSKFDDTGGSISGSVDISGDLIVGTTNIIDELGTKQDEINDGDLCISKTSGLQAVLDNKYNDTGGTIDGDVDITGGLSVNTITLPTIGDVETSIQGNANNLTSVQTQVDSLIDIFSQGISFRAYSLSSATVSSGQNLPFDNESYDSQGTYDTSTYIYTIDIAGTYLFNFGWFVVSGSTAVINLYRKRSGTAVVIQQSTNGTFTANNTSYYVATIVECETGDEIYAYLGSGSCRLAESNLTEPNNDTSFSGSRLSR